MKLRMYMSFRQCMPRHTQGMREVIAGGLAMLTVKMKLSSIKPGDTVDVEE